MSEHVWSVREILDTARRYFEEKGIENPRGNAEALLGKVLGLPRIELYLQHERPLTESEIVAFRELLRRRVRHEPLQQILGTVEFAGATIETPPGVLIPRPETEELTELAAREIAKRHGEAQRVLDLGTGSGCIAVALAKRFASVRVDAVDSDFEALQVTMRNAALNSVSGRVQTILGDLFGERFLERIAPPYDMVISNPPYISDTEFAELAPEVRGHEPRHALLAGEEGLAFYRRIATLLPALLGATGTLMLEIGATQAATVRTMFEPLLREVSVTRDMSGRERFLSGRIVRG